MILLWTKPYDSDVLNLPHAGLCSDISHVHHFLGPFYLTDLNLFPHDNDARPIIIVPDLALYFVLLHNPG